MPVNDIIHLSDAALIGVHALSGLARSPDKLVPVRDLAAGIGASENHLAKVMQRLVRSGIARSVKGPTGGFALARPAESITFKAAIEAVDGPLTEDFCPFKTRNCNPSNCIFGSEIAAHAQALIVHLDKRTIADIIQEPIKQA